MAPARAGQDPTGAILEATGPGLARTAPERCQRSHKNVLETNRLLCRGHVGTCSLSSRDRNGRTLRIVLVDNGTSFKYIVAGFVTFGANVVRALVTERML